METRITSIYERALGGSVLNVFGLVLGVQLEAQDPLSAITVSKPILLSDPPETRSPGSLKAINDPNTGNAAFSFDGQEDPL